MDYILRNNQREAIDVSINNDFKSGIHYHATGTGKSLIAIKILEKFNQKYPDKNVLWICERKDVLLQQFTKDKIKENGYDKIIKKFNVLDFVEYKIPNWHESLDSARFWGKPFLCIINRCFLTSNNKYIKLKCKIDLVIHDECHSIENKSTRDFYHWLININHIKYNIKSRIIGFSATPELIFPLDTILSKYSIYDGFKDNVILPPKILWLKSNKSIDTNNIFSIFKHDIDKLPYKKIIVWCGMIEECIKVSQEWYSYFKNFKFCIDFNNLSNINSSTNISTSTNNKLVCNKNNIKYGDYNNFYKSRGNSILFCAIKHREGSDIPNLDCCIFMDMVSKRSQRVFIQCIGRVLRVDKERKKKYGLVIDLKAKSAIEICNRVQYYLKLKNIFPWDYKINLYDLVNNKFLDKFNSGNKLGNDCQVHSSSKHKCFINELTMVKTGIIKIRREEDINKKFIESDIKKYFVREIPGHIDGNMDFDNTREYTSRLNIEIKLILDKGLFKHILRALDILNITKNIPHITRGSCGSSLVCYMLGISHVDPIKYKISFSRFLNKWRDTLPDIDFDFPHYLRDEVFLKIYQKWGNNIARISNHNYYHDKSALRESMRINGIRKFVSKYEITKEIKSYNPELKSKIYNKQKELQGKFKGYSLHCGGIIYFPDGIPSEHILDKDNSGLITQVDMNKIEVSKNKHFKIDILSSRGLSQLYYCHRFNTINFDTHLGDKKTIELLSIGDNIGITLAETPLMRKALMLVKPKTIMELAICLAIIRPAAKKAKEEFENGNYSKSTMIFDDDIIYLLAELIGCDQDMADKIRRDYCKGNKNTYKMINSHLKKKSKEETIKIKKSLTNLRKYSFCKAHALSYAQLVWQLAYQKANYPVKFWKSTLKNISSCYRKWVHIHEGYCKNVYIKEKNDNLSIYAKNKNKPKHQTNTDLERLKIYGYWNIHNKLCNNNLGSSKNSLFFQGCYFKNNVLNYNFNSVNNETDKSFKNTKDRVKYKGIIAASRLLNRGKIRKLVLFVGFDNQVYKEIIVIGNIYYDSRKVIVEGEGQLLNNIYNTIESKSSDVRFI
tara:strand:+ start:167 stop:3367 length:3201 start_codon:yes stop_codon:yes gene_type:complete